MRKGHSFQISGTRKTSSDNFTLCSVPGIAELTCLRGDFPARDEEWAQGSRYELAAIAWKAVKPNG